MAVNSLKEAIAASKIRTFRRAYIKRRLQTTGLFESDWLEVTSDVKKWGSIKMTADSERPGKYTLDSIRLVMHNDSGRYNPHDDPNSLWSGYINQQRSLVKIEAGLMHQTQGANGIWSLAEYPSSSYWDEARFDEALWDSTNQLFVGIISGELSLSDRNEVTIQAKPLTQIFKDYPAAALTGLTSTGMTASQFMTLLRDQTDGSSNFIFRPFFGDTTTNWDISATSNVFSDLNTTTANDIRDATVWDVVEKLAEAENFTAYVDQLGVFHFTPKTAGSTVAFEFHGLGSFDTEFGHTIKSISRFGKDYSKFYSRVQVKYREEDTSTSYVTVSSAFQVTPTNAAWAIGHKTFQMENIWIPTSTVADTIANALYSDLSALKDHIEFTTSFVPHLNLLDRVSFHYDSTTRQVGESTWDANDWDTELTWDDSEGDAIVLQGEEFKFLSIEINLDTFECKYLAREI